MGSGVQTGCARGEWAGVAWRALTLTLTWLVIVNVFGLLAFNRLNVLPDTAFEWMDAGSVTPTHQSWNLIDLHNRWDSYWYLDIAKNGYYLRGPTLSNVVFFPLYPLLMRAVAPLCGGNLVLSGWIVSCVFLFLAVAVLIRLVQEFHPRIDPCLPPLFLLTFPMAFFLNAVYSESLFLFLSLTAVYYARRGEFLKAAVAAGFASATRIAGVFLCVLLLVEFLRAHGWRALFSPRVLSLALAPAGILLFFLYHWYRFDDFFLYIHAQTVYGRDFIPDLSDYDIHNNPDLVNTVLDLFYTIASLVLAAVALRLRLSYGLYMLTSLGIALSSGTTLGIARYAMVLFPIHLIGAGLRSATARQAWLFASALMLALNIICFANHYWAD
jgi:hypothetical protein